MLSDCRDQWQNASHFSVLSAHSVVMWRPGLRFELFISMWQEATSHPQNMTSPQCSAACVASDVGPHLSSKRTNRVAHFTAKIKNLLVTLNSEDGDIHVWYFKGIQ